MLPQRSVGSSIAMLSGDLYAGQLAAARQQDALWKQQDEWENKNLDGTEEDIPGSLSFDNLLKMLKRPFLKMPEDDSERWQTGK